MKNYLFITQSLILIQMFPAFGQETQSNAWNAFFSDFSLTSSTTIRTEIHYRSVDFYSTTDQILFRPQIILAAQEIQNLGKSHLFVT